MCIDSFNSNVVWPVSFILSPFVYSYISITQTDKRTDYPGRGIATKVQLQWDKKFSDKKILRIYGDEWIAGNLCYHLKSRPKCIIIHGKKYVEVATDMESILFKLQELEDLK